MAKKKQTAKSKKSEFDTSPFRNLKGFSAFGQEQVPDPPESRVVSKDILSTFSEEMEMLGVQRLSREDNLEDIILDNSSAVDSIAKDVKDQSDDELFLAAVGDLSVRFEDHLPEDDFQQLASPRRMKQLKQGRLLPDASLDLHGCQRTEVTERLRNFLQNAQYQGWQTLLLINGKGLHSEDGTPILREEAEQFLSGVGKNLVAEWGRAPQQYGGDGALVLFLRRK